MTRIGTRCQKRLLSFSLSGVVRLPPIDQKRY
jgi:hypothetical protein